MQQGPKDLRRLVVRLWHRRDAHLQGLLTTLFCAFCVFLEQIPRPSRCAFFLPFAEKAIYCVVCSKKSLFLLKVLLQNLANTWSANVAFWSGNVAFGSGNVAFSSSSWFRKTAKYAKMR